MKKRWYIAGKITGLGYSEAFNNFLCAEAFCRLSGAEPVNPMRLCNSNWCWLKCVAVCLYHLSQCQTVVLQVNWQDSRGARIEKVVAELLFKPIIFMW